jgi:hypothetical protein
MHAYARVPGLACVIVVKAEEDDVERHDWTPRQRVRAVNVARALFCMYACHARRDSCVAKHLAATQRRQSTMAPYT